MMNHLGNLARAAGRSIRRGRLTHSTRRLLIDDITGTAREITARVRPSGHGVDTDGFDPAIAPPFDVDLVYTWVDDNDPAWATAYARARSHQQQTPNHQQRDGATTEADHPARYENHNELRYSMRSVWRYAGWFRSIFVVTAGHQPDWLAAHPRVTVISHDEIIHSQNLPTFNSHAIEAALHRIEGLSEHFIYLNDDFFLARSLDFNEFFDRSGRPQISVSEDLTPQEAEPDVGQYAAARHTDQIIRSNTDATAGYLLGHTPYPQLRSLTEELETRFAERFEQTESHRFRHPDDLSVPASLAPWYAIATDRADPTTPLSEYVSIGHPTTGARLRRLLRRRDFDTFCLNWTEHSDPEWNERLVNFLVQRFPDAAPWEDMT